MMLSCRERDKTLQEMQWIAINTYWQPVIYIDINWSCISIYLYYRIYTILSIRLQYHWSRLWVSRYCCEEISPGGLSAGHSGFGLSKTSSCSIANRLKASFACSHLLHNSFAVCIACPKTFSHCSLYSGLSLRKSICPPRREIISLTKLAESWAVINGASFGEKRSRY